jgi:hypothetical protein
MNIVNDGCDRTLEGWTAVATADFVGYHLKNWMIYVLLFTMKLGN